MSSGELDSGKRRFPERGRPAPILSPVAADTDAEATHLSLDATIQATQARLLEQQHQQGYWVAELQGDTILESEYILLLCFLGRGQDERARQAANYILQQQLPGGGWAIYPGGPVEASASVKAYLALKLTGHSPDAAYMRRARSAILDAGGVESVNSFTRYYLALLGVTAALPAAVSCSAVSHCITQNWAQGFLPASLTLVPFPVAAVLSTALVVALPAIWVCHRKTLAATRSG